MVSSTPMTAPPRDKLGTPAILLYCIIINTAMEKSPLKRARYENAEYAFSAHMPFPTPQPYAS